MTTSVPPKAYWQAEGLAQLQLSRFAAAVHQANDNQQRRVFYRVANYHARTLHILQQRANPAREALYQAALHNLLTLHRALIKMDRTATATMPLPTVLHPTDREIFARDLVMRVLSDSYAPQSLEQITTRVNQLNMLGKFPADHVAGELNNLIAAAHVSHTAGGYQHTTNPYTELDFNAASLRAITHPELYAALNSAGFHGLQDIDDRPLEFTSVFNQKTGFSDPHTAERFIEVAQMLLETTLREASLWQHTDLIHSPYPRPYQRAALTVFQRGGYNAQLIEAPTGSGKTMIGMLAIQDWLRSLQRGQSILVLVPTSNYQQQWIDEISFNPIGLQLSPQVIFAGTPTQLENYQHHTGGHPALLLMTYAAMAQLGSPRGKGGFDAQSLEIFLQEANIQYVILDEVHKVAEDMHSVTSDVTRLLVEWRKDESLRGLIGFSGTAEAYRDRFAELGQSLDYSVPIDHLVAAGFVAPYAELGIGFAYSDRELKIREKLDTYKAEMAEYFDLLNPAWLRRQFAEIPLDTRMHIGHEILGMYRGRRDWQTALRKRFVDWEKGPADKLSLTETKLVTIIQIAHNWSDTKLATQSGADDAHFQTLRDSIDLLREDLRDLIYLPKTLRRLNTTGFSNVIAAADLLQLPETVAASHRSEAAKDLLATTIVGLYDGLSEWYLRVGEGRVETIKAIIRAERNVRPISGIIVFDNGHRINWHETPAVPGYQGVGGLFSQMLGDNDFTVLAALSGELYLSHHADRDLTGDIAAFITQNLMAGDIAHALFNYATQGIDISTDLLEAFRLQARALLRNYLPSLDHLGAGRPGEFNRLILNPLRREIRTRVSGTPREQLLNRLNRRNVHLNALIHTLFDYALLAKYFREAEVRTLQQVSGAEQQFYVIKMPGTGQRKQLMYDLISRVVDAEELGIDMVIVSSWARTGWNVLKPNLLIDATATRDVTAWSQLRGRAIRARRSWSNDCYRLMSILTGDHRLTDEVGDHDGDDLDPTLRPLLASIADEEMITHIETQGVTTLSAEVRQELAVKLMETHNKVTHIYELIKAYGSGSQVGYNRDEKRWERKEHVAAKHTMEISVNPFSGEKTLDEHHAPLLYVNDPRNDRPTELEPYLAETIALCDPIIVGGWLAPETDTPVERQNEPDHAAQ